ncbi:MAG: hypothetical protein OHK0053_17170 [Microscillaceae bacterium]
MTKPPLLTIEILCPSQSLNELVGKTRKYFEKGVRSCWVVIPILKNIYVFSSAEAYEIFKQEETLHDAKMEFEFSLSEVFV